MSTVSRIDKGIIVLTVQYRAFPASEACRPHRVPLLVGRRWRRESPHAEVDGCSTQAPVKPSWWPRNGPHGVHVSRPHHRKSVPGGRGLPDHLNKVREYPTPQV